MIAANKTYGFTIAVKELRETVPNIFRYASAYKRKKGLKSKGLWEMFVEPIEETEPDTSKPKNLPEDILKKGTKDKSQEPIVDDESMEGESYNMCHFWSNFEIARLSWFRSQEYEDFFQTMDRSGGFWMERVSLPCHAAMRPCDGSQADGNCSGVMRPSIPSPPVLSWAPATFITSETLGTGTQRSSTVRPMRRQGSCREKSTSR